MATKEKQELEDHQHEQQQLQRSPEMIYQHYTTIASTLPKSRGLSNWDLYRHPDGWHASLPRIIGAMVVRDHFAALPSDVLVATYPKSGTTWIKALAFATMHRKLHFVADDHPLNSSNPHICVPFLEFMKPNGDKLFPIVARMLEPRVLATHIPFGSLPASSAKILSGCKIIYVARETKDVFISLWHFISKFRARDGGKPFPISEALESFCGGVTPVGSYWDHVLGYWIAHLERPEQVMFMLYEELMRDTASHVKKLAEFLGCPLSVQEEEEAGMAEEIVKLCGFENLSHLDANKEGNKTMSAVGAIDNSWFFRRGVAGDWKNHLSLEMASRVDEITASKFKGSGLTYTTSAA